MTAWELGAADTLTQEQPDHYRVRLSVCSCCRDALQQGSSALHYNLTGNTSLIKVVSF